MSVSRSGHVDALTLAMRWQLAARRRDARGAWMTRTLLLAILSIASLVSIAAFPSLRERIAALLGLLDTHALPFGLLAAAFAWTWSRERRRKGEREYAHSWLAAAPIAARDVTAYLRRRAIADFGVPCIAIFATLAIVVMIGAHDINALLATSAFAVIAGFATGWRSGRHALADAPAPLPRLRHRHATTRASADLGALRRWPFAQWLADAQPRQHVRVIAALLLGMPMGIPVSAAIGIVFLAALALAAVGLLRATRVSIAHASGFLRTTPPSIRAFASNLMTRALVAETFIAASAAAVAIDGGASIAASSLGAVAWLLVCAALCVLALRREQNRGTNP